MAVVGGGIAGLSAAYLLSRRHEVVLFEKDVRLGGHAHTHAFEHSGRQLELDSGFLVYNHRTYPNFVRLLAELGVEGRPSDMSFSVRCRRCRLEYSTRGALGLFAQPYRLLDARHLRLLSEIPRFNRLARGLLERTPADQRSLGDFLAEGRFSDGFVRHFMLPLVGAVWSASSADVRAFPVRSLFRFMQNHGWLDIDPPQWWTVSGGSRRYVDAIVRRLGESVRAGCGVNAVRRDDGGVTVTSPRGDERFEAVVLATHADQALALLSDPSDEERRLLGAFRYSRNRTVLHTDARLLPRRSRAWASWNMDLADCQDERRPVSLTYHLNRLQSVGGSTQFCVSLNTDPPPNDATVLAEMDYSHPILDAAAVAAQAPLSTLSGQRNTYFAGAHLRWGFHEDGLLSGMEVAAVLGCPFTATGHPLSSGPQATA